MKFKISILPYALNKRDLQNGQLFLSGINFPSRAVESGFSG